MRELLIGVGAGALLLASPARASNWQPLFHYKDKLGIVQVFVEIETVTTASPNEYHGVTWTMWGKILQPDTSYVMAHYTIDCDKRTVYISDGRSMDKFGNETRDTQTTFESIAPDTVADGLRGGYCKAK